MESMGLREFDIPELECIELRLSVEEISAISLAIGAGDEGRSGHPSFRALRGDWRRFFNHAVLKFGRAPLGKRIGTPSQQRFTSLLPDAAKRLRAIAAATRHPLDDVLVRAALDCLRHHRNADPAFRQSPHLAPSLRQEPLVRRVVVIR